MEYCRKYKHFVNRLAKECIHVMMVINIKKRQEEDFKEQHKQNIAESINTYHAGQQRNAFI